MEHYSQPAMDKARVFPAKVKKPGVKRKSVSSNNSSASNSTNSFSPAETPALSQSSSVKKSNSHAINKTPPQYLDPIPGITRVITACQRCRSKKIKCDKGFPTCSNCFKSNSECFSFDVATGREVPRSYIAHLESKINILEMELQESRQQTFIKSDNASPNIPSAQQMSIEEELNQLMIRSGSSIRNSFIGTPRDMNFSKLLILKNDEIGNLNKFRDDLKMSAKDPKQEYDLLPLFPPKDFIENSLVVYFNKANDQLPIIHRDFFIKTYLEPIYGNLNQATSSNLNYHSGTTFSMPFYNTWSATPLVEIPPFVNKGLFFIYMILAISTSVNQQNFSPNISEYYKIKALSFIDYVWDVNNSSRLINFKYEILQCLLLLSQYSLMRPSVPGIWYLAGSSLRLAIDLGLNYEDQSDFNSSPFELEMKRRLFWCAYSIDRQVSICFGRPFSISDAAINTRYPSELDDCFSLPGNNPEGLTNTNYRLVSIYFFELRQIQSSVNDYLGALRPNQLTEQEIDIWKINKYQELLHWYNNSPPQVTNFNKYIFDLNFNQTVIQIYGISKLTPYITNLDNYTKLYEAGKRIIFVYDELTKSELLNYSWIAINNLFIGGTCYLYSIYNNSIIRNSVTKEEIQDLTGKCITVLDELLVTCNDMARNCQMKFRMLSDNVLNLLLEERGSQNVVAAMPMRQHPQPQQANIPYLNLMTGQDLSHLNQQTNPGGFAPPIGASYTLFPYGMSPSPSLVRPTYGEEFIGQSDEIVDPLED